MHLKRSSIYLLKALFILSAFCISACGDDDEDPNTNPVTDGCTMINGFLKWDYQGTKYCANASLFADQGIIMTVNGITQAGLTMTLELDSVQPGTYQMKDDVNHLLFTDNMAFDWQSTDGNPGTITITKNDTVSNVIEGTFSVNAKNSITGTFRSISNGNFRLIYTE